MKRLAVLLGVVLSSPTAYSSETAFGQLRSFSAIDAETTRTEPRFTRSPAANPTATEGPYLLRQVTFSNQVYFFDVSQGQLRFFRGEETPSAFAGFKIYTNALVYAVAPTKDSDGFVIALPEIRNWVDLGWRFHTIDVLKEQILFNRLLLLQPTSRCTEGKCVLSKGRGEPLELSPIPLTGIVDESTFKIPVYRLELAYDRLFEVYLRRCSAAGVSDCSQGPWPNPLLEYWHGEIARARYLLDSQEHTRDLLASRFPTPTPVLNSRFPCASLGCSQRGLDYIGSGDYEMLRPYSAVATLQSAPEYDIAPNGKEPETQIATCFNPAGDVVWSDGVVAQALRRDELSLWNLLERLEKEGATLFGHDLLVAPTGSRGNP